LERAPSDPSDVVGEFPGRIAQVNSFPVLRVGREQPLHHDRGLSGLQRPDGLLHRHEPTSQFALASRPLADWPVARYGKIPPPAFWRVITRLKSLPFGFPRVCAASSRTLDRAAHRDDDRDAASLPSSSRACGTTARSPLLIADCRQFGSLPRLPPPKRRCHASMTWAERCPPNRWAELGGA
jgi:hypothetical protein